MKTSTALIILFIVFFAPMAHGQLGLKQDALRNDLIDETLEEDSTWLSVMQMQHDGSKMAVMYYFDSIAPKKNIQSASSRICTKYAVYPSTRIQYEEWGLYFNKFNPITKRTDESLFVMEVRTDGYLFIKKCIMPDSKKIYYECSLK